MVDGGPARSLRSAAVPAAALFGLVGLTLVVRALSVLLSPHEPNLFAQTAAQAFHFIVLFVSEILIVFALLMMAAHGMLLFVGAAWLHGDLKFGSAQ